MSKSRQSISDTNYQGQACSIRFGPQPYSSQVTESNDSLLASLKI